MVEKIAAEFTERIQRETQEKEDQVKREREALEAEKLKMGPLQRDEVIEINVGGEVFATKRRTLLQAEGTVLEAIFSGRWEGSLDRDAQQRVFLDYTPALFRSLLSYLRARRDAKPGQIVLPPTAPTDLKCEYESMVGFLGLSEYMRPENSPAPDALTCKVVGADATIAMNGQTITRTGGPSTQVPVIGQRPLLRDGADLAVWRVTVVQSGSWFMAGVVQNTAPVVASQNDATAYAWCSSNQVYIAGKCTSGHSGWGSWQAGDVALFQLDATAGQLKMFHRRTAGLSTLSLGVEARGLHLHLNFYSGTTVVKVEPATEQDIVEAGFL